MEKAPETKLQKLLAQKEALEARIRQQQGRERKEKHKLDTRRKVLAGAAVLAEAEQRPEFRASLMTLLGRFLIRPDDRALFGLPPLPPAGAELSIVEPARASGEATQNAEAAETRAA
ncbi:MAG: mobilization protein C [Acetobacteraceae bacterium]